MVRNRLCLQTEHSSLVSQLQSDLLRDLGLLLEDGLLLPAEALLLVVVAPPALREEALLALLVLRDFVLGVLLAVVRAVRVPCLRHFDHLMVFIKQQEINLGI